MVSASVMGSLTEIIIEGVLEIVIQIIINTESYHV